MNERIRQLADKVWAEEYLDNRYPKNYVAQLKKFVEVDGSGM